MNIQYMKCLKVLNCPCEALLPVAGEGKYLSHILGPGVASYPSSALTD